MSEGGFASNDSQPEESPDQERRICPLLSMGAMANPATKPGEGMCYCIEDGCMLFKREVFKDKDGEEKVVSECQIWWMADWSRRTHQLEILRQNMFQQHVQQQESSIHVVGKPGFRRDH